MQGLLCHLFENCESEGMTRGLEDSEGKECLSCCGCFWREMYGAAVDGTVVRLGDVLAGLRVHRLCLFGQGFS